MNEIDLNRVDLNLLVVFEVLMETRSVTATAEKIGRGLVRGTWVEGRR